MANLFRCAGGGETLNCIAKPFDQNETYTKNDVVLYNNLLYICIAYGVTGEWDSTKWQQTTLEELSSTNPNIFYGIEWLEDEYDSTLEYNTDDTCMHRGLLYKCLEDGVTGEWDSSKWERTYLLDCTKLNSNLNVNQFESFKIYCNTDTINTGITTTINTESYKKLTFVVKNGSTRNGYYRTYDADSNQLSLVEGITSTSKTYEIDVSEVHHVAITLFQLNNTSYNAVLSDVVLE